MRKLWHIVAVYFLLGVYTETSARIGFYPQKEYRYEYVGQVFSGLPNVADDKAAVAIAATVIIQSDSNSLIVQLDNVRAYNGRVLGYGYTHEEVPLPYQSQSQPELRLPFRILYKGSTDEFNGVETSADDPAWSVNIKKALAVFLQVRLDQQLSKRQGYFADRLPSESFEPIDVIETGVEGKCPTKYVYTSIPYAGKPFVKVLNVTKFRDIRNCDEKPVWMRTILESLKCAGCEPSKEAFANHGSVSHYDVYEESGQYTIQSGHSYSQSDTSLFPPKGDIVRISQFQRLNLKEVTRASTRLNISPSGRGVRHTIMGTTPEDVIEVSTKPRFKRQATKTGSYSKISPLKKQPIKLDKKGTIRKIIDELNTTTSQHKEPDLYKVTKAVDLIRLLTFEEIQDLYNSIEDEDKRRDFVDFVVMSGTDAAILYIKHLIERKLLKGENAVNIVSNIAAYILEPKPAILEEFWNLCKASLVKESRQLYVTALLTFGELVNQACVPKERPKTVIPFHPSPIGCPSVLTTRYLQEVTRAFDLTPDVWEKVTLALTLMRMGLNNTIDYIAPLLKHKYFQYPPSVRTTLLMSLYETGPGRETDVVKSIMPIFYNTSLTVEERMIAMDVIAYTTTSQQIMNQLAMSTWHEPNRELHSYIYSYLITVGNMTQTCWASMAHRSRQALTLAKPIEIGIFDSRYNSINHFAEQWGQGSLLGYVFAFSPRSSFPQISFVHVANQLAGYYYSNLEMMFYGAGLQKSLDYLTGPQSYYLHDYKLGDLFKKEPLKKPKYKHDDLNIVPRDYDQLNTFLWLSYLGTRHRIFFLDDHTTTDLRQSGILPSNKDFYSAIRDGIPVNIRKYALLEDSQAKFTSVIGIPLTFEFKAPLYIDVSGKIFVELSKSGNALSSIAVRSEIRSTFALNTWVGVQADVPFTKTQVGTFVLETVYLSFPLYGNVNVDLTQKAISTGLRHPKQTGELPFFSVRVEPTIYVHNTQTEDTVKYLVLKRPKDQLKIVQPIAHGLFGQPTTLTTSTDMTRREWKKYNDEIDREGLLHSLTFLWAPHKFNQRSFEISYLSPGYDTNLVELNIDWKLSPSNYHSEIWRGLSALQKIRPWNLLPEWSDWPLPCDALDDTIPYKPPAVETTTKKSWFSRFKDKVKSTFGRSGGDDGDSEEADDDDNDDDDDRGRALHPHLVTGTGSDTGPGSRSAITGDHDQSRSQQGGYYGQTYGQTHSEGGQDYGQTYGQTRSEGGQDYGQTTQDLGEDYSQQASKGQGGYAPGTGGHSTYPYKPSSADQLTTPKKSVVNVLNFKDETSTTLVAIQLTLFGDVKSHVNADITYVANPPQGVDKLSVSIDLIDLIPQTKTFKVCYTLNLFNQNTQCPSKLNRDGVDAEARLQWGQTCDNTNYVNSKGNLNLSPQTAKRFEDLKHRCNLTPYSYVSDACMNEYRESIFFTREFLDIKYSQSVLTLLPNLTSQWEKWSCRWIDYLTETVHGNFVEDGRVTVLYNYHEDEPLLDAEVKLPQTKKVYTDFDYQQMGPHVFPKSPYYSYPFEFIQRITRDQFAERCQVNAYNRRIDTFNGLVHNFSSDGCEYVVAKDCSPSQLFTVTATGEQNKLQKVKIYLVDHTLEFTPSVYKSGSGVTFEVDGKKQTIQKGQAAVVRSQGYDDHYVAAVSARGPQVTVKSALMGLVFTFTPENLRIILSRSWKGKSCGLCGESTGQSDLTFIGPNQCLYSDPEAFSSSYRISTPKCPQKRSMTRLQCLPLTGDQQTGGSTDSFTTLAPVRRTHGEYDRYGQPIPAPDGYPQPGPFDQHTGFDPFAQISQTADSGFEDSIGRITQDGQEVVEEPIKPVTQRPSGGGDEGRCYVRRNILKRRTDQVKGNRIRRLCFSTEAIRQCRRTCDGVNLTPHTVKFKCYDEPDSRAEQWAAEINDKPLPELFATDHDFEEELMVAQDCITSY